MGGPSWGRASAACSAAPVPARPPSRWPVLGPFGLCARAFCGMRPGRWCLRPRRPFCAAPASAGVPYRRRGPPAAGSPGPLRCLSLACSAPPLRRRLSGGPFGLVAAAGPPLGGLPWWLFRLGAPAAPQTAAGLGLSPRRRLVLAFGPCSYPRPRVRSSVLLQDAGLSKTGFQAAAPLRLPPLQE